MFEISWSINKERSHVEITTSIALEGLIREDSAPKEFQAEVSATNVEIGFARFQLRAKIVRKKT